MLLEVRSLSAAYADLPALWDGMTGSCLQINRTGELTKQVVAVPESIED